MRGRPTRRRRHERTRGRATVSTGECGGNDAERERIIRRPGNRGECVANSVSVRFNGVNSESGLAMLVR